MIFGGWQAAGQSIFPIEPQSEQPAAASQAFTLSLLAAEPVKRPMLEGSLELRKESADGALYFTRAGPGPACGSTSRPS